jgi:hypothetical protein
MGIQTIVDRATFLTVDKRKLASQSISRSGRIKTAEVTSAVPYRFTVGVHEGAKYSENRAVLEELDALDVVTEEQIDIGSTNTGLSYITAYQGGIATGTLTCVSTANSNITVDASGVTGSGTLFKKGDFLQPVGNTGGYRYPYQVTSDVAFSTGSSVVVPVHRPVIDQTGVALTSGNINIGSAVKWYVKMTNKPAYTILPYDRFSLDDNLELVEIIQ